MSASSLLASLARAQFELGSMSLTDLSDLRAQAEQDLVDYGPRFELDRQRRLAMCVQNLREQPGFLAAQAAAISSPAALAENTSDRVLAQVNVPEASIAAKVFLDSEPTIESEGARSDTDSIQVGTVGSEFIDLGQSFEKHGAANDDFGIDYGVTQPLDALTEIASERGDEASANAIEIASALGGATFSAAATGTLDRELTGLEDADQLEELSLAELEASDLLSDGSSLDPLGDDDSSDPGGLFSPVDSFDEDMLPEDEPVPGSVEAEGLDFRLHPDALSLDGERLQPVSVDLELDGDDSIDSLVEALEDEDGDSAFAEAFGDYEDAAPGEQLDEDGDAETAWFEVAGDRGGGVSGQVVRDIAKEHRSDEMPAMPTMVATATMATMPTIKDRTIEPGVHAAAAIRLNADGSSEALMSDDEENIEVEMPDAGEEYDDEPESQGMNVDYVDEIEYVEEEECAAPQLDVTPTLQTFNDGQVLSGDDFSPGEEVDSAAVAVLLAQADEALERGDLHAAAQAFSDTLEFDPESLEAYLGRGRCALDLGDFAAAMSDFQKAEDLDGEGPEPLVAMGELFFARKEYTRAIEFFDQAVEMDAEHAMARCRRGISYYYKKSYRQAFLDLQKAYTLDPDIPNIRKYVQMAIKKLERSGETV